MPSDEDKPSEGSTAGASSRRTFVKLALSLGGAAVAAGLVGPWLAARLLSSENMSEGGTGDGTGDGTGGGDTTQPVSPCDELAPFRGNIRAGGPPKDGIPAIDNPKFMSAEAADAFLRPEDVVFGLDHQGVRKAYPQRILVWHEIANDHFDGRRLAITYCPLTGSQVAFELPTPSASETLGVSGSLVNSNLLMYDRATDSNWPQILGTAINGDRCASVLTEVPLVWATWDQWRRQHPDTVVLTTETGFLRNYNADPYGSYTPEPGGYYGSGSLIFPVMNTSDRFHPKKIVFGVRSGGEQLAIPLAEFRSVGVRNTSMAGASLAAVYDARFDTIRVFRSDVEGETLTFQLINGHLQDVQTASVWSVEGVAQEGPFQGVSLPQVNAYDVMWFAWYAFYPGTQVLVPEVSL